MQLCHVLDPYQSHTNSAIVFFMFSYLIMVVFKDNEINPLTTPYHTFGLLLLL